MCPDELNDKRRQMVLHQLRRRGIHDENVLTVMEHIPRECFIPPQNQHDAYEDRPVLIGLGQTISQPYMVAYMTEQLQLEPHHSVLEIGTGCGYQTAILARLARKVCTIEILAELAPWGRQNLANLEIENIEFHTGDGWLGWPQPKEFDRILLTAACEVVPPKLMEQLTGDGRLIAPVGQNDHHRLMLFEKRQNKIKETFLCHCTFVKMVHGEKIN